MAESPKHSISPLAAAIKHYPLLKPVLGRLKQFIPLSARLRENLLQWLLRAAPDPDFYLFDQLRDMPGLFLDVGANRGHSAIAVLRRTRRFRVVSLEPNPELRWCLWMIRLLHPWRFRFRLLAAGNYRGSAELAIPLGNQDLSSQASLDPGEFEKPYVQERLQGMGHGGARFRRRSVQVCPADDLELLAPDVVKIDVEGWEAQVLQGMSRLLAAYKPVLIIEINNIEGWAPGLATQGYLFYTLEEGFEAVRLVRHENWAHVPGLNVICCHPASNSPVTAALLSGALN